MMKLGYIVTVIFLILLQSCCIHRSKDYPKYSKIREVSNRLFTRFSGKVETIETDNSILFVFDKDTISLSNLYKEYSCLFSSGLISNQMIEGISKNSIKIFKIEELKYCFRGGKSRMFHLSGAKSNFFNGLDYYIEIRNTKACKCWKLEKFVINAKVNKLATFIQI